MFDRERDHSYSHIHSYLILLPLGMFCVRRRDVCLSVLLHLILEGWGGGAASESVPLLVCTTTGYMVEDMLRTWGEMQLHV